MVCIVVALGILWRPAGTEAALVWRGEDLGAQGIHKGAGLPLFAIYLDGAHSSFATQELDKHAPPWTLFVGTYNQYYYADSLRDDQGHDVPGQFHVSTYLQVARIILLTPIRTERVQHFFELVPTFVATKFAVGAVSASAVGPGDLAFGTGLNFPEVYESPDLKVEGLVDVDLFFPTGHYQPGGVHNLSFATCSYLWSNDLIFHFRNVGYGLFFEPSLYFAGSTVNPDFRNPLTGDRTRYQLGQTVQALFKLMANLDRASTRSLGVEGFFDFQYLDDRMGGSRIHDSAERALMLGPIATGVIAGFLVDASVLREFDVVNRPEGTRFTVIVYRVF